MASNSSGSPKREKPLRIDVSPEELRRIEALELLVESDSKAATIRDGLKLFEFIKLRQEAGWEFLERSIEGESQPLTLPEPPASAVVDPGEEKVPIKILVKDSAHRRLKALKEKAEVGTMTGLIRGALRVYEHLAHRQADGWTFSVRDNQGREKDLVFMNLPHSPPQ